MTGDRVFTTGQAAKLAYVSQQTIIRCVDDGSISAHRVPGSRFRRIPERSLWRFMIQQGIPTDRISGGKHHVLVVTGDPSENREVGFEFTVATSAFELGLGIAAPWNRGVIIDYRVSHLPTPERLTELLLEAPFDSWRRVHLIASKGLKLPAARKGLVVHRSGTTVASVTRSLVDELIGN